MSELEGTGELCRICLSTPARPKFAATMSDMHENLSLALMFSTVTSYPVLEHEPKIICDCCKMELITTFLFHRKCEQTQHFLWEWLMVGVGNIGAQIAVTSTNLNTVTEKVLDVNPGSEIDFSEEIFDMREEDFEQSSNDSDDGDGESAEMEDLEQPGMVSVATETSEDNDEYERIENEADNTNNSEEQLCDVQGESPATASVGEDHNQAEIYQQYVYNFIQRAENYQAAETPEVLPIYYLPQIQEPPHHTETVQTCQPLVAQIQEQLDPHEIDQGFQKLVENFHSQNLAQTQSPMVITSFQTEHQESPDEEAYDENQDTSNDVQESSTDDSQEMVDSSANEPNLPVPAQNFEINPNIYQVPNFSIPTQDFSLQTQLLTGLETLTKSQIIQQSHDVSENLISDNVQNVNMDIDDEEEENVETLDQTESILAPVRNDYESDVETNSESDESEKFESDTEEEQASKEEFQEKEREINTNKNDHEVKEDIKTEKRKKEEPKLDMSFPGATKEKCVYCTQPISSTLVSLHLQVCRKNPTVNQEAEKNNYLLCDYCGESSIWFKSVSSLCSHMKGIHKIDKAPCTFCKKPYYPIVLPGHESKCRKNPEKLWALLEDAQKRNMFICRHCGLNSNRYVSLKNLRNHLVREHIDKKNTPCMYCHRLCFLDLLESHQEQCSANPHEERVKPRLAPSAAIPSTQCMCPICGKTLGRGNLHSHLKYTHVQDKRQIYTCDLCDKKIIYRTNLIEHMKSIHLKSKVKCNMCTIEFRNFRLMHEHRRLRHSEIYPPFKCDRCDHETVYHSGFLKHVKRHLGDAVKKHECSTCGQKFHTSRSLINHEAIHSDKRNFECSLCAATFKTNAACRKHRVAVHIDTRAYECPVCGKSFNSNQNMRNHVTKKHPDYQLPPAGTIMKKDCRLKGSVKIIAPVLQKEKV